VPTKLRLRSLFKSRFLVKGLAKFFNKLGLKPNHVTVVMILFSILAFLMLVPLNNLVLFGIFVFVTMVLDGVDGTLARMTNQTSEFGGFWDSTLDRISEGIIFGALLIQGVHYYVFDFVFMNMSFFHLLVILSCFGSYTISYLRARASNDLKKSFDLDVGLLARSERLFVLFLISIIPNNLVFSIGFIILTIGILATALYRFFTYLKFYNTSTNNGNKKETDGTKTDGTTESH